MSWVKQILTGSNNETLAIGRIMGVVLLVLAILMPIAEIFSIVFHKLDVAAWGAMLAQWQVFMPIIVGTAGGVIAGTAFTEPRP